MSALEIIPPDEETAALSTEQLLYNLTSESPYLRGRVLAGLGKRLNESPVVFNKVMEAIEMPENRYTAFFGFIMVSWIGIIAVLENGSETQISAVNELVKKWSPTEQEDILYHVKGTNLPLNLN